MPLRSRRLYIPRHALQTPRSEDPWTDVLAALNGITTRDYVSAETRQSAIDLGRQILEVQR